MNNHRFAAPAKARHMDTERCLRPLPQAPPPRPRRRLAFVAIWKSTPNLQHMRRADTRGSSPIPRRRHLRIATAAVAATAAFLPTTAQGAPTTERIHMTWLRSGTGTSAPFRGTGTGEFTASGTVNDVGTVFVTGQDTSVPSPVVAVAWLDQLLTSPDGALELRCHVITQGPFTDPSRIPIHGSCTIISTTGVYAGMHGHGDFTGFVNLTVLPAGQATQDITLNVT